jgi:hypothetical protein
VSCSRCDRIGKLSVKRLILEHGELMTIPALRKTLAPDCPRRKEPDPFGDGCDQFFPQLPKLFPAPEQAEKPANDR